MVSVQQLSCPTESNASHHQRTTSLTSSLAKLHTMSPVVNVFDRSAHTCEESQSRQLKQTWHDPDTPTSPLMAQKLDSDSDLVLANS